MTLPTAIKFAKTPLTTLFTGLSESEVTRLNQISSRRQIPVGGFLMHQHSEANSVYIVEEGVLMMERNSATGRRQVVAFSLSGNFIGIAQNEFYEFSVSALTPVTVKEFPMRAFMELQEQIPQLKDNVRRIGGNILAHALDQVFALGQKKAHERVSFLIQQLLNRKSGPRTRVVELVMTRQDIADYLGLTIETVSRAFTKLKQEGIIAIHSAHTVEILDPDALQELALSE
ncbi:helix-turn-helix domain-containing protein [Parahaliea maris]|uniref:Helix-turn-helix domain-containing protein n=1 Tax=Parahaliea maris TaxID=2716870 RepID=A0A5C9A654_9GAMM|nr:helix-turn-helix domain-containing protein [Parahaliea maris]TXS96415.1 helix-turn-helix domain-containing protein [Parahaliea maris]